MTTESSMWKWLKQGRCEGMHLERHENLVASGAPDVWGYFTGGSLWIELKQATSPKKEKSKSGIKVRPSQKFWFKKMTGIGCRTHWFLIQIDTEKYLVPGYHWGEVDAVSVNYLKRFNVSNQTPREILEKAAKGF